MSSHNDDYWFPVIIFCIIILGFTYFIVDQVFIDPGRREAVTLKLKSDGISVQEVTINSPNIYIEIDDYEEFKQILDEQNTTQVYCYFRDYYVFNDDYTLAWRINYMSIYDVIKTK